MANIEELIVLHDVLHFQFRRKPSRELQRKDTHAYEIWLDTHAIHIRTNLCPDEEDARPLRLQPEQGNNTAFSRDYLERFRTLVGLPYADTSPVWHLVAPRDRKDTAVIARCDWAYQGTAAGKRSLETLLREWAEANLKGKAASPKDGPRMHARAGYPVPYSVKEWFQV